MTQVVNDAAHPSTRYRQLIDDQLWDRLVRRVAVEERIGFKQAESIMDATLGFLQLCAEHPGRRFAPSRLVDIGWHTFILYTKSYADFCHRVADRYIHHEPNDVPGAPSDTGGAAATIAFMRQHGICFNLEMWVGDVESEYDPCNDKCCSGPPGGSS